jgi:protein-L-isoaspartate O-methyltransferase
MTQSLLNVPRDRVLEVGTGSGYQAAVLAHLVKRVYTVERIQPLIERAEARFRALRLRNIRVKYDDGHLGWPEQAPFDGILVTAAARSVPEALVEQLGPTGRMVIPVGGDDTQELRVIDRTPDGLREESIEFVRFVPLLRARSGNDAGEQTIIPTWRASSACRLRPSTVRSARVVVLIAGLPCMHVPSRPTERSVVDRARRIIVRPAIRRIPSRGAKGSITSPRPPQRHRPAVSDTSGATAATG